jgi:hypothetical protein
MLLQDLQKIDIKVTQDELNAVLSDINRSADEVKDRDYPGIISRIQSARPGTLSAPTKQIAKPVQPTAIAPIKPAETPVAQPQQTSVNISKQKQALLAEIEDLKAKKELADLEKQALALKAELLAAQAEVLTVGTDLAEQENSHKLWTEAAPGLVDMAAQNGKLIAEDAIGRQKAALGELHTVSKSIKLDSEIAVERLRQQQAIQENRWLEIRNKTPQLLPAMSQESSGTAMKTVETIAV